MNNGEPITPAEFGELFKEALEQGWITFGCANFQGWHDTCECPSCSAQRAIHDYLWPEFGVVENGDE